MPAEIDTGGPRVLHCDYRADCPIPIVATASSRRSGPVPPSIVRPRRHDDERPNARRWSGLSARRTGSRRIGNVPPVPDPRRRPDDVSSRPARDESRLGRSPTTLDEDATIARTRSRPERTGESSFEEETRPRLETRIPTARTRENESDRDHGWREEPRHAATNRAARIERRRRTTTTSTAAAVWLSDRSNDPSRSDRTTREKLAPDSSGLPSLAEETRREADATNSPPGDRRNDFSPPLDGESVTNARHSGDRRTRRRKRKRKRRECLDDNDANGNDNHRSAYIRLALLLFLVAFGQCGPRKTSALGYAARPGATTGLSVLAIGTVIGAVSAAPVDSMADAGVRAERSANLSHITGASRKIQMYIKNRHLQILPDGTVNGSNDDTSDYTIFQRTSVSRGQLRIQGVATCLYLCMDSCGLLYGSREYTDDCVFNETLEQHNYNTYSSAKWSTAKKTLYLGLNRRGQPRRVQAKGHNLGRLSAYARVLTQVAPSERVEALQRRMLGAHHNVRHRHNSHRGDLIQQSLCPTLPVQEKDGRDKFRCRKRKKRKKRKRKCRPGEKAGPQCQSTDGSAGSRLSGQTRNEALPSNGTLPDSKRSCEGAASDEACRREALTVPSKKRKLRVEESMPAAGSSGGAVGGGNVSTASSNGKSKAPVSNAKKVNAAAGSASRSKKPDLTDGKKRKKKGPPGAGRRGGQPGPLARKRFTPARWDNTSAVPTPTTISTPVTSFSSWWSVGASTGPSGKGVSPRRRVKPSIARLNRPAGPVSSRRTGKGLARNRTRTAARTPVATTTATVVVVVDGGGGSALVSNQSSDGSVTASVPDRSLRDSSPSSAELDDDASRSLSESLSIDEDASSTLSGERATTIEPTFATSIEAASTAFASVEETDDADDGDGSDAVNAARSTTPGIPLERLAM